MTLELHQHQHLRNIGAGADAYFRVEASMSASATMSALSYTAAFPPTLSGVADATAVRSAPSDTDSISI